MTEQEAFLAAIAAEPHDEAARVVYADWLDEHGQEKRAQFIRLQCRLARMEKQKGRPERGMELLGWLHAMHNNEVLLKAITDPGEPCECEWCLNKVETNLFLAIDWQRETTQHLRRFGILQPGETHYAGRANTGPIGYLRRGFAEVVLCSGDDWCAAGHEIRRWHPVCEVLLSTWPARGASMELYADPVRRRDVYRSGRWPGVVFTLPPAGWSPGAIEFAGAAAAPVPGDAYVVSLAFHVIPAPLILPRDQLGNYAQARLDQDQAFRDRSPDEDLDDA